MKDEVTVKAVVDRFEGERAVLLVGQEERQAIFPAMRKRRKQQRKSRRVCSMN